MDLKRLFAAYDVTLAHDPSPEHSAPFATEALDELYAALAGSCLNGGLYRVHTAPGAARWAELAWDELPAFRGRAWPFGVDWLGRQFAVDRDRLGPDGQLCLLLERGTGEVLELPYTVTGLHTDALVDQADAALAVTFYEAWRRETGDARPLLASECVGYRLPLFLGGADEVANLERSAMEVYWSLASQLRHKADGLPEGTRIKSVRVERRRGRRFRR